MHELFVFDVVLASELNPVVWASGAVIVGLLSGVVGATLGRMIVLKGREDRPEVVDAARATAIFIFLFFTTIGVVVAVGVVSRESLRPLPAELVSYSPHVLAAGLIVILGRALGHALYAYTVRALARTSTRLRAQLAEALRFVVTVVSIVLALRQLGIDTGVLNILVAAVVFGLALAFALLVGLGGRELSRELALGRYLHRILSVGHRLSVADVDGVIVALHPATVEVLLDDGTSVHVANSQVFGSLPRTRSRRSNDSIRP